MVELLLGLGDEEEGELGNGVMSERVDTLVAVHTTEHFTQIDTWVGKDTKQQQTTRGVTTAGAIFCRGSGRYGRLGNGDDRCRDQPTAVKVVDP